MTVDIAVETIESEITNPENTNQKSTKITNH